MKDPNADAYLMLQDDAVLYDKENLREWLETILWPGPNIAAISLYCSSAYNRFVAGWHQSHTQWTWGALAFVFPNQAVRRILADASIVDHCFQTKRQANIDVAIGRWARQHKLDIYYPNPSLVQHIGESSTIWPTANTRGKRRANWFAGGPHPPQFQKGSGTDKRIASNPIVKTNGSPTNVEPNGSHSTSEVALAFVTCFFNPAGYQTQRKNYERFREGLGEIANHLWTIELAFDDDPFTIEAERTIRVRGKRAHHQLWQKERLLNLAQEQVPSHYNAVGYIDCDLLFDNPAWYDETRRLLERYRAVQLFTQVSLLSATGAVIKQQNTVVANPTNNGLFPGGGWAFRRKLWPIHDMHIMGGGDTLYLWALKGRLDHGKLPMMTDAWAHEWAKQAIDVYRKCGGRIASTRGTVRHLYHGSLKNRLYRDRWRHLFDGGFDPGQDLEIDPEVGIWRWTDSALRRKSKMVEAVSNYFLGRKEDD
ncbi:hypothetical protein [Thalassoroseus pseudoceratinae]|uniref:hypothetical protein n=1 Tax=Thalassoroseus pseudoceratinae TaxID=2713176 RepID=UPI0014224E46|nr:hypothetical protein [Thalassoroseus pseudoceratinae]